MRRFVLVDHSLRRLGGHHYPYARSVLEAAERAGYAPVLAAHRDLREPGALPAHWTVHPLFRRESYTRYTLDIQALGGDATRRRRGGFTRLRSWLGERARARHVRSFAADCARLFELEPVGTDDLVLFATTSELDFAGLCRYLGTRAPAGSPAWHAQFHFGLYGGRDPGYAAQHAGTARLRAAFEQALALAAGHRLALHCTTPQLAAQYATLGVAAFGALPYPVDAQFAPREPADRHAPVRIACLGHARREKGYAQLPELLRALWPAWLAPGKARLLLQTHRGRQRRRFDALAAQLARGVPAAPGAQPVEYAGFPLPLAEYVRLLTGADLGLLLYDATRYYARCSGVLLEMQCAGVPVLVPAGSWLAEQVEPANQRWLEQCAQQLAPPTAANGADAIDVPEGTRTLLLAFEWEAPAAPGRYLRVEARPAPGQPPMRTHLATHVLGAGPEGGAVRLALAIAPGARRVQLQLSAAWQDSAATPPARLTGWQSSTEALPAGLVGLTLAEPKGLSQAVEELLAHHAHYLAGARAHAADCRARQSATRVVEALVAATIPA